MKDLRQGRDNDRVRRALEDVRRVAAEEAGADNNLMPPIIEAVKAYSTTGEICDTLREVWGEYVEPQIL